MSFDKCINWHNHQNKEADSSYPTQKFSFGISLHLSANTDTLIL